MLSVTAETASSRAVEGGDGLPDESKGAHANGLEIRVSGKRSATGTKAGASADIGGAMRRRMVVAHPGRRDGGGGQREPRGSVHTST